MVSKYNIAFPLYVRLDDGEVMQIESFERILHHLEAIDIENNEYRFWDADGQGLKVLVENDDVSGFQQVENEMTLSKAFLEYAKQLGVWIDASGTPNEIWARLHKARGSTRNLR